MKLFGGVRLDKAALAVCGDDTNALVLGDASVGPTHLSGHTSYINSLAAIRHGSHDDFLLLIYVVGSITTSLYSFSKAGCSFNSFAPFL